MSAADVLGLVAVAIVAALVYWGCGGRSPGRRVVAVRFFDTGLTNVEERVARASKQLMTLRERVQDLYARHDRQEAKLNNVDVRVDALMDRVEVLEARLAAWIAFMSDAGIHVSPREGFVPVPLAEEPS